MVRRLASPFAVVALVWAIAGLPYLFRTPDTLRAHDAGAHIAYTRTIMEQGRLPTVSDTYQGWQPPLYYLAASTILPNSDLHTTAVRVVSWLFGLCTLALVYYNLRRFAVARLASVVALVFLATTPKFVMYFTTYNNDAAVGVLAVAIVTLLLGLRGRWVPWQALALWALAVVAINVKLTVGALFAAIFVLLALDWWTRPARRREIGLLILLGVSVPLTLLTWILLHNLPTSGELLPTPLGLIPADFALIDPPWRALTPPALMNGEWVDPYGYSAVVDGVRWKASNFWSFHFVTSIYGEYIWMSPPAAVFWGLVWVHAIVLFVAVGEVRRSAVTTEMGALAALGVIFLIPYPMLDPYTPNMDFRFIAWTWLPYTVLLASAIARRAERAVPVGLYLVLAVGAVLHLAVVFAPESCCW